MISPTTLLVVLAALAQAPPESVRVELSGTRFRELRAQPETPPGPSVVKRTLRLEVVEGGVRVHGRWQLSSARPAWFANVLVGPRAHVEAVTIDGAEARTWTGPSGVLLVERIDGEATVELRAFVAGSVAPGLAIDVMGASRGTVEVSGAESPLRVEDVGGLPVVRRSDAFVSGSANLRIVPAPPSEPAAGVESTVIAQVGLGLTVGDAEVKGRGRLRWIVRRGDIERVSFTVAGMGTDLRVEGPNVAQWRRSGDRIDVTLRSPADGRVDVLLAWSAPVSKAADSRQSVPAVVPQSVFRIESSLQIARDGEVDVVPTAPGWSPIASAQLPEWGEGLVDGAPTAAFKTARGSGTDAELNLLRYVPVAGPPMVIDVADVRVASSRAGRYAMRVRYEIRNERSAHLLFRPPAGTTLTGITVAGQPTPVAKVGDAYRIPLPRSLETLEGLTLVPVVVGLLGEDEAWRRRARGQLELPRVNAPIGVLRGSHVLPPEYRTRLSPGDGAVVDGFSRGKDVAYGLDDDAAASQADQVYADAVEDWNNNEFEDARDKLGKLGELGARNKNTVGLDSNVTLVLGDEDAPEEPAFDAKSPAPAPASETVARESVTARRIRAQARARASKKRVRFKSRKKKAKELQDAGRYDEAEAEYERAIDEAKDLDRLEDSESKSYEFEAEALAADLEETQAQSTNRDALETGSRSSDEAENSLFEPGFTFGFFAPPGPEVGSEARPEVGLPPPLVPIVVPLAGHVVQHEFLLLEADAQRSLEFDAIRPFRGQ